MIIVIQKAIEEFKLGVANGTFGDRTPIVRLTSIGFGNRTLRKVPVRLCSITEKIKQQFD